MNWNDFEEMNEGKSGELITFRYGYSLMKGLLPDPSGMMISTLIFLYGLENDTNDMVDVTDYDSFIGFIDRVKDESISVSTFECKKIFKLMVDNEVIKNRVDCDYYTFNPWIAYYGNKPDRELLTMFRDTKFYTDDAYGVLTEFI